MTLVVGFGVFAQGSHERAYVWNAQWSCDIMCGFLAIGLRLIRALKLDDAGILWSDSDRINCIDTPLSDFFTKCSR